MIELYSTNLTATNGMTVTWGSTAVKTNAVATLNSDGETISLNVPGIYEITVNSSGTTTAAGTYGFQLYGSGNAITRAEASTTTDAGETGSVSFAALINVASASTTSTANLTVVYTGGAGTISLANIIVKRVS